VSENLYAVENGKNFEKRKTFGVPLILSLTTHVGDVVHASANRPLWLSLSLADSVDMIP
jgi:hypothetical protein